MKEIFVLSNGWVLVGVRRGKRQLTGAKVIERWGTTHGLGQLAANGPTSETRLRDLGEVELHAKPLFSIAAPGWS